jgi:hypothetical protein
MSAMAGIAAAASMAASHFTVPPDR